MSKYLIYGKVVKSLPLADGKGGKEIVEPQTIFRALSYSGQRVTKLTDAGIYEDRDIAQKIVDKAKKYWENKGYGDYIQYEIRKAK